ncbi:MAG: energy-coupling factor transporter transmembrane protein EcfT [Maledivibacter sp.]|jgi:energy-coupling factor transport system permease protein|nr:energy-coupling factor transporter transmembrane protein EcfT [Maledivibacter sp.]
MEQYVAYYPHPKKGFQLDPRTKILFMAFVTTLMFYAYDNIALVTALGAIPFILLLLNSQRKTALIYGGLFILAIIAVQLKDMVSLPQVLNSILVLLIALVMRLFPTFMLGYYIIESTKANEFITAMKRWHVSENLIIPVTVVFRFIPTIQEEYRFITDAMRMREIQLGTKKFYQNPGVFLEYRLIPLMISIVKIGEELSAAALTRGLGSSVKRTNIAIIGFGIYDGLIFAISILLLIWTFL